MSHRKRKRVLDTAGQPSSGRIGRKEGSVRILQALAEKWQAFRAWQENPTEYTMDGNEHVCNNCGHRFKGNYCPVCSQSASDGRVSWLALYKGISLLWGMDSRSAVYTLWQLFLRPGYLVRDYISGKRQLSYPPVKLLFILAAVVTVLQYFFPLPKEEFSESGFRYVDLAFHWLEDHQSISALAGGCIFILPTWVLFRNAPLYPRHTIPEGFFLQVYVAILTFIIGTIFVKTGYFALVITYIYTYITYKQLFGYGWWGTMWRLALCTLLSFATMLALVMAGMVISKIKM